MKKRFRASGFTLIEMIIAITVFTIFIGFAISSYLVLHRANQEVLIQRSLMLEAQGTMNVLTEAVRENRIDYAAYEDSILVEAFSPLLGDSHVIHTSTLFLLSPDEEIHYQYTWDEEEQILTAAATDSDGNPLDAYADPLLLHGEESQVTYAAFRIFPDVNPYVLENASNDDVQYQPTVQIDLEFSIPGRIRELVTVDLQSSVTSRFYQ